MAHTLYQTIRDVYLCESRGYGGWLSPSGKEFPVRSRMEHEKVAKDILGDEAEELQGMPYTPDEILGHRGWARLVHEPSRTFVDIDKNVKLTGRQLSYLKDLGIENQVNIFLDVGTGRFLYRVGDE